LENNRQYYGVKVIAKQLHAGGLLVLPLLYYVRHSRKGCRISFGLAVLANLVLTYVLLIFLADHPWLAMLKN